MTFSGLPKHQPSLWSARSTFKNSGNFLRRVASAVSQPCPGIDNIRDYAARPSPIFGENVARRNILVVSTIDSVVKDYIQWLDVNTLGVRLFSSWREAIFTTSKRVDSTILLIDIDMFLDVDEALDELIILRTQAPNQVVTIASSRFSKSDLSCERSSVADASLRLPLPRVELALGLGAAVTNHRHIKVRNILR